MHKYRPAQKPLFKRLASSVVGQALALTLVIAVGVFYLQKKFADRLESQSFSVSSDDSVKEAPSIDLPARKALTASPQEGDASASATTGEKPANTKSLLGSEDPAETKPETAPVAAASNVSPGQWVVTFLEVPRSVYEVAFYPNEKFVGQGQIRGGPVAQINEAVSKYSRELGKETKNLSKNELWDIFKGQRQGSNGQDFGFSLQMQMNETPEKEKNIQFNYLAHIPVYAERKIASVETIELSGAAKGGFFIAGGMPRKVGSEEYLLNGGAFEILSSSKFKDGETEFVILVMPK